LSNDLEGQVTLADLLRFTKNALITISSDALREEQSKGFDKEPTLVVDNKFNRRPTDVSPLGKIEYIARIEFKEMVIEAYRKILYHSKVVTGRYISSNVVTYNGSQVANNMQSLEAWLKTKKSFSDKDIIRFVNYAPYARKLETLGITRQKTHRKRVERRRKSGNRTVTLPNGAYAMAYASIKNRFKKNSFIGFDLLPGNKLGITGPGTTFRNKKKKYYGQPYIYPSIIIRAVSAGLTDAGGMLQ
jgi:hypothetical protein